MIPHHPTGTRSLHVEGAVFIILFYGRRAQVMYPCVLDAPGHGLQQNWWGGHGCPSPPSRRCCAGHLSPPVRRRAAGCSPRHQGLPGVCEATRGKEKKKKNKGKKVPFLLCLPPFRMCNLTFCCLLEGGLFLLPCCCARRIKSLLGLACVCGCRIILLAAWKGASTACTAREVAAGAPSLCFPFPAAPPSPPLVSCGLHHQRYPFVLF